MFSRGFSRGKQARGNGPSRRRNSQSTRWCWLAFPSGAIRASLPWLKCAPAWVPPSTGKGRSALTRWIPAYKVLRLAWLLFLAFCVLQRQLLRHTLPGIAFNGRLAFAKKPDRGVTESIFLLLEQRFGRTKSAQKIVCLSFEVQRCLHDQLWLLHAGGPSKKETVPTVLGAAQF